MWHESWFCSGYLSDKCRDRYGPLATCMVRVRWRSDDVGECHSACVRMGLYNRVDIGLLNLVRYLKTPFDFVKEETSIPVDALLHTGRHRRPNIMKSPKEGSATCGLQSCMNGPSHLLDPHWTRVLSASEEQAGFQYENRVCG